MILCITEKPDVADKVANVLNITTKKKGYYEGNGYLITWCFGHLVSLAEPECYKAEYGYLSHKEIYAEPEIGMQQLPLFPEKWKYVVPDDKKVQFNIIKSLMWRDDVDRIYDLGDCGSEGIILQALVRMKAGNGWGFNDGKKPVYRWNVASMTPRALKDAIENITPPDEAQKKYFPVIRAELCKKHADWILGMSVSRAASLKHHAHIQVGRVQSPTLAFVVSRFLEVTRFKVTDYYGLRADVKTGSGKFSVYWNKDEDGIFAPSIKDSDNRVLEKSAVESKAREIIAGKTGTVTAFESEKKSTRSPQLYDTVELQSEANRRYGYSAAQTLAAAQVLYEKYEVTSYPRTDSRFLTPDDEPDILDRLKEIGTIAAYADSVNQLIASGLNIDDRIIAAKAEDVEDHTAIIPTEKIKNFDFNSITTVDKTNGLTPEVIRNILNMIITRFIVALAPAYQYQQSKVEVTFPNRIRMTAGGTIPLQLGWKGYQDQLNGKEEATENAEEQQLFPPLKKGDCVSVDGCIVDAKKTSPPKLYTEATLLKAMLHAGSKIENGAILRGKGIGTQATRGDIIAGLFKSEVVKNLTKGKTNYIVPTQKGISVIRCLPKELYSPGITADWEMKISNITKGTYSAEQFMQSFRTFITDKVHEVQQSDIADLKFDKEKEVAGVCPFCGKSVYVRDRKEGRSTVHTYYCSDKDCAFAISSNNPIFISRMGKQCTKEQVKQLIGRGFFVASCKSARTGKSYKCKFSVETAEKTMDNGDKRKVCNIHAAFA